MSDLKKMTPPTLRAWVLEQAKRENFDWVRLRLRNSGEVDLELLGDRIRIWENGEVIDEMVGLEAVGMLMASILNAIERFLSQSEDTVRPRRRKLPRNREA